MNITAIDHVVFNVADPEASLAFYSGVLGLQAERAAEFRRGEVKFPSARVGAHTIIDFFPPNLHDRSEHGANVNHVALNVEEDPESISAFCREHGITIERESPNNFGARGEAHAFYVRDPDGNVVELRTYEVNGSQRT